MTTLTATSMRRRYRANLLAGTLAMTLGGAAAAVPPSVERLVSFTGTLTEGGNGAMPGSNSTDTYDSRPLIEGPDGNLYGAMHYGIGSGPLNGVGGDGRAFYRYHPDQGFTLFEQGPSDSRSGGRYWRTTLTIADGQIYDIGPASENLNDLGLQRFDIASGTWHTLWSSTQSSERPARKAWIKGTDNRLYNTTANGSAMIAIRPGDTQPQRVLEFPDLGGRSSGHELLLAHSNGRIYGYSRILTDDWAYRFFSVAADGSDYRQLAAFDYMRISITGLTGLIELPDGRVAAMQGGHGEHGSGTLFLIDFEAESDALMQTLHDFGPNDANIDGINPNSLTLGPDGHLYGTAASGGINGTGTIFRWHQTDGFQTLYAFDAISGPGKNLYGYVDPDGNFTNWGSNHGSNTDGITPTALIASQDGNFYGLTQLGGDSGWGTLFRLRVGDEVPVFNFEPKLSFSATAFNTQVSAIALGQTLSFVWRGQKVSDCVASSNEPGSAPWSGTRPNSSEGDSHVPSQLGTWTYTLTCQTENGPLAQSATVKIVPVNPETEVVKDGGGALAAGLLPLLALAGLGRRRQR